MKAAYQWLDRQKQKITDKFTERKITRTGSSPNDPFEMVAWMEQSMNDPTPELTNLTAEKVESKLLVTPEYPVTSKAVETLEGSREIWYPCDPIVRKWSTEVPTETWNGQNQILLDKWIQHTPQWICFLDQKERSPNSGSRLMIWSSWSRFHDMIVMSSKRWLCFCFLQEWTWSVDVLRESHSWTTCISSLTWISWRQLNPWNWNAVNNCYQLQPQETHPFLNMESWQLPTRNPRQWKNGWHCSIIVSWKKEVFQNPWYIKWKSWAPKTQ